jgi:hypothetical protein
MGSSYIKAKKKFISKELVMKKLKLYPKEFDRLVVLCGVHPYIPKDNRKVDMGDGFYYRISDANKLMHSDTYKAMVKNKRMEERKQRYIRTGLEYKVNNICYEEHGYVDLVKDRSRLLREDQGRLVCTVSWSWDCLGSITTPGDFVVCGTAGKNLVGLCEALYRPDMNGEDLFVTCTQAFLNAIDRDALSGWGADCFIINKDRIIKRSF